MNNNLQGILLNLEHQKKKIQNRLEKESNIIVRSNLIFQIGKLDYKINEVKDKIKYGEHTLKELMPKDEVIRRGIHISLIKVSLASDYLYDCLHELKCKMDAIGLISATFYKEIERVSEESNQLASKLIFDQAPVLQNILLEDDEMVDKIHNIINEYIINSINPK